MKSFSNISVLFAMLISLMLLGCKQSMVISKVDYSQPVETVLVPDSKGIVSDVGNSIQFNILPLQYQETKDTTSVSTKEIRMIRGKQGFYYITASGYQNVYVMAPEKESLRLETKIKINESGLQDPVFNQRNPYVQLLNRSTGKTYVLTNKGIAKPKPNNDKNEV